MIGRRKLLGGLMVGALGGEPPRRPDQMTRHPHVVVAPGGAAGTFRGRLVVVYGSGSNQGVFVYSGTPALGNLVASVTSASGTDSKGNAHIGPGVASYTLYAGNYFAAVNAGAAIQFYRSTGGAAGPYVLGSSVAPGAQSARGSGYAAVDLLLLPGSAGQIVADGALLLPEQSSAPSTPSGAGALYVDSAGDLYYLGPSGTSTKLASA